MSTMSVNSKRDAYSYGSLNSYQREICDVNTLYQSYMRAKQGSDWKPSVQRFEMNFLLGLTKISNELNTRTYEFKDFSEFILSERGKQRLIKGEAIEDRIVKHNLCDVVLNPIIYPHLIYDNGASQLGKGISFTRRRLEYHLHDYFQKNGTNEGWVLLVDYSKYYDNIRHQVLLDLFEKYIPDDYILWLVQKTLDRAQVDVSYMDESEYVNCIDMLFDSLKYYQIPKEKLTGELFMAKHLNIGDQVSQTAGVAYRNSVDQWVKTVLGVKYYDVYMDDTLCIHRDKEFLKDLSKEFVERSAKLGITANPGKTRIEPLGGLWRFLKIQYSLTETGEVVKKIHPKRLTAMRHRMKSNIRFKTKQQYINWYKAWFRANYKIMSKEQRQKMDHLCEHLVKEAL